VTNNQGYSTDNQMFKTQTKNKSRLNDNHHDEIHRQREVGIQAQPSLVCNKENILMPPRSK